MIFVFFIPESNDAKREKRRIIQNHFQKKFVFIVKLEFLSNTRQTCGNNACVFWGSFCSKRLRLCNEYVDSEHYLHLELRLDLESIKIHTGFHSMLNTLYNVCSNECEIHCCSSNMGQNGQTFLSTNLMMVVLVS